jgi:cytochrome c peroxidase
MMSLGVRENMEACTKKGFMVIQFQEVTEETLEDTRAYLRTLDREPSPYLVNGKLSAKAEKGKKIFEDGKVGCAMCHPAPLFTDLKQYEVGTGHKEDRDQTKFDTTQLVDLWATAPYLHDGSAPTMMDVLTTENKNDKHGTTSHLSKEELDALVEYLLSL